MTTSCEIKIEQYGQMMKGFFGEQAEKQAKESKFVVRESKIDGRLFLLTIVWAVYRYGKFTLSNLVNIAEALSPGQKFSEQGFSERFNEQSVIFLQAMFGIILRESFCHSGIELALLNLFSAVYLLDSTTVKLPLNLAGEYPGCGGAGAKASAKLYLLMDWLTGTYQDMKITPGRKADQNMGKNFVGIGQKGALWLTDLGFWDICYFEAVALADSYFLSRLHSMITVQVCGKQGFVRLELDKLLALATTSCFELRVSLGPKATLPVRLICLAVPPQVAAARRRRARETARKKKRAIKKETLARLDWQLFVTNAPTTAISTRAIATVYKIRWQVELTFKLAKTDANLDESNGERRARVLTELYAKLISLIVFQRLMRVIEGKPNNKGQISYVKAWRNMKETILDLAKTLYQRHCSIKLLQLLVDDLARKSRVSKRVKYPSTLQSIIAAAQQSDCYFLADPLGFLANVKKKGDYRSDRFFSNSFIDNHLAA